MTTWLPDAGTPLFILAMDHRASFARDVFAITTVPTAEDVTRMRTAKSLIYEGLRQVTQPDRGRSLSARCPLRRIRLVASHGT
jgi:hypothetical protein